MTREQEDYIWKKGSESFMDYLHRISPKGVIVSELWGGYDITYEFDLTMAKEEDALFFIKNTLKKEIFTDIHKENKIHKFSVKSLLNQYNKCKIVRIWADWERKPDAYGLRYTDV